MSYPLLSDKGSAVIRKFGILNANVPDGLFFSGIPFPGDYLLNPDGAVREKYFLPDYQTRPTASEVVLKDFGGSVGDDPTTVQAEDVRAKISLSDRKAVAGAQLGIAVEFEVGPGWHIYGQPLPEGYTPTSVVFDDDIVTTQKLAMPKPSPVRFAALNETLMVYEGSFKATGNVLLKQKLTPGEYKLKGTMNFQECNDLECKIPQAARFEIPLQIVAMAPPAPKP